MQIVWEQRDEANTEGYSLNSWDQMEAHRCLNYITCLLFEEGKHFVICERRYVKF